MSQIRIVFYSLSMQCKRKTDHTFSSLYSSVIIAPGVAIMTDEKRNSLDWDVLINDYRTSGKTASVWCQENGFKMHQLRWQITKRQMTLYHYYLMNLFTTKNTSLVFFAKFGIARRLKTLI